MTDGDDGGFRPRRQWPLWTVIAIALAWSGIIVSRSLEGLSHAAGGGLDLAATLMPPVIAALIAVSLLRAIRPDPDIAALEARLARADADATRLQALLGTVDATLASCAERTGQLAEVAAADGTGLGATATRLTAAAAEVRQSGADADMAATRIAAALPSLTEVQRRIDEMGGRLASDTVRQLEIIEALLAAVQVRGDEVAAQSDAAIASINKQLAEIDEASRATTSRIAKRAYALDAAVDGASARSTGLLDSVASRIADTMAALDARLTAARGELEAVGSEGTAVIGARLDLLLAAAASLGEMFAARDAESATLRHAVDSHLADLPRRLAAAHDDSAAALEAITARTTGLHVSLDGLAVPLSGSHASIVALGDGMDRLQVVADRFGATLAAGLPEARVQLDRLEAGTGALDARVGALNVAFAAGDEATRSLATLVAALRGEVAALGEADLRVVDDHMNATAAIMHDMGRQIATYGALSGQTKAAIEADVAAVGGLLRTAHDEGRTRLGALTDQIGGVREAIDDLTTPIEAARRRLGDVETQVGGVDETAAVLSTRLAEQLAATATAFAALREQSTQLLSEAAVLQTEIASGGAAITAVSGQFAAERAAFAEAAGSLGTEFGLIRDVLAAIDSDAARVAASTAGELGATFARARDLADENATALRALLANVVAEAERMLGDTGAATAASAFGVPIQRELAAVGEASKHAVAMAEAAARRVAGEAKRLDTTIEGLTSKVAELETQLDVRARDTLSSRASRLLEMLQAASVDVAKLMAVDAGEDAWVRYAKGDRSLFARRTVRLVDGGTSALIARHFAHDPAFKDEAAHYLELFETLSRRLLADPDGENLMATVVSSDIGKLYVAIARATGHWSPVA